MSQLEDEHDLWDMGHCSAAISVTLNGNDVSYLKVETTDIYTQDSKIVLKTPTSDGLLGPQLGRLTVYLTNSKYDNFVLLEQDFTVTILVPDCPNLSLNAI